MPDKQFTGYCGPHCPLWGEDHGLDYTDCLFFAPHEPVQEGDLCSVPPCGPWQNIKIAPKDGTILRLLVLDGDGTCYRQCDGYYSEVGWIESSFGLQEKLVPIAFAIINKPWEVTSE